jgi:hypothetical protein
MLDGVKIGIGLRGSCAFQYIWDVPYPRFALHIPHRPLILRAIRVHRLAIFIITTNSGRLITHRILISLNER